MTHPPAPLVSVVTPFYNPAPYFVQCIESVLAQDYPEFEYILLDNHSTDGSFDLAQSYASKDSRVRVLRNATRLGATQNHNEVLRQISPRSKYVKVLQADDWLFPSCLKEMVRVAEANPTIGVVGAYTLLERSVYLTGLPHPSEHVSGRAINRRLLLEGLNVLGSPTATLIRADLVRARPAFYNELSPIDDLEVCVELLMNTDFGFVNQVLSFTRRDNPSAMTTLKPFGLGILSNAMVVSKYGKELLTPEELAQRTKEVLRDEYRVLAEGLLKRRPKAFWDLHRNCLALVGHKISKPRIAWHVLEWLCDRIFNPLATAQEILHRARTRR
jgi:glycosyltransferase involved in cell wall biosynthesis